MNWYRPTYVACVVLLSVQAAVHAKGFADHHFWLPLIEVIGALLFLPRATRRVGLVILLLTYAVAGAHALLQGEAPVWVVLLGASAIVAA
jgi:hypothetical protein